ncbi:hypothetical protein [Aurantiacibacter luteus]|uniref:Uncharacterized protein n=1 Tax=Aurantiacibacter luteus TaxID=1581420 RepID=A0A0G9MUB2_9SPHN|nr:hypothetical protein [Aurantiacibacter luteus]KLE34296.1 hypothetical protein AAW00_08595 [Aurantiacibacter luteus]
MTTFDRRRAIALALAAALAPVAASRGARAQVITGHLIAPPAAPMIYRRQVSRELVDGNRFSVARDFAVRFEPFAGGYSVRGEQLAVAVEAPPALARFADLERQRDESGLFPIALDAFGRILEENVSGIAGEGSEIERAFSEALAALSALGLPSSESEMWQRFVGAVHAAGQGITAYLPVDLFAPAAVPRREEQNIALPGGGEGMVSTMFSGETDRATGLMRAAEREVTTETEGSRRTTVEHWTLAHAR